VNKYSLHIKRICIVGACLVAGLIMFPATVFAGFGIDPGKVQIDNLYPGAQAEFVIDVYNQNDYDTVYSIVPRTPDYTKDGREFFPHLDWITITPGEAMIERGDKSAVTVVISMPEDAEYFEKQAEAWISFREKNSEEMVQVEIISRVLINTGSQVLPLHPEDTGDEQTLPVPETSSPAGSQVAVPTTGISATDTAIDTEIPDIRAADTAGSSAGNTLWIILGSVAGVLLVLEVTYLFLRKYRSQH
jgi:subtilisin family serine protease